MTSCQWLYNAALMLCIVATSRRCKDFKIKSKNTKEHAKRKGLTKPKFFISKLCVLYSSGLIWNRALHKCKCSAGMDMWNAPTVQSRQPLTYRLMESVGLGGPR